MPHTLNNHNHAGSNILNLPHSHLQHFEEIIFKKLSMIDNFYTNELEFSECT